MQYSGCAGSLPPPGQSRQYLRSRLRYCTDSARCAVSMISDLSRSAMVRPPSAAGHALADRPSLSNTFLSIADAASVSGHAFLSIPDGMRALLVIFAPLNRSSWIARAHSPFRGWQPSFRISGWTRAVRTQPAGLPCKSILSSRGPEIRDRYELRTAGEHLHSLVGWPDSRRGTGSLRRPA